MVLAFADSDYHGARIILTVATLLTLALATPPAQLTDTVQLNAPCSSLRGSPPHSVVFRPAGSRASPSAGAITADVPGSYVLQSSNGTRTYLRAVNLTSWSVGAEPLMADEFGANASPLDTDSGFGFWQQAGSCKLIETSMRGLEIDAAGTTGLCGLRTRDACPMGSAVHGCGFSSGLATLNPFADQLQLSLGAVSGAADSVAVLRLEANETGGAIELRIAADHVGLRWAPEPAANWTRLHHAALPSGCTAGGGFDVANMSLSLSLLDWQLELSCTTIPLVEGGGGGQPHGIDWRTFAPRSRGELGVAIGASGGAVSIRRFEAISTLTRGHLPALLAPVPDLSGTESPYLGGSHSQRLTSLGYLDTTQPPFSADPTGAADATAALQAAIEWARRHYLAVWLPAGASFRVTDTLVALETERLDAVSPQPTGYWQQARYVPNRVVGSTAGAKPKLVVPPHTPAFSSRSKPRPVVWFWMRNGQAGTMAPPYDGNSQPNANCNQILQGVDIEVGDGNAGAIGIRARGAQMMVVQDVTVRLGADGFIGLSGGSGSGGSHYGVTVVGGAFGVDYTTAQPGPVVTGFTLVNQSCSALVYAGLQTLTVVGLRVHALEPMAQPAIVTGCDAKTSLVPGRGGALFGGRCQLPQFVDPSLVQPCLPVNSGALSLVDSIVELGPWAAAARNATAVAASNSVYASNVHVKNAATLFDLGAAGASLKSPAGGAWASVGEFAHGVPTTEVSANLGFTSGAIVHTAAAGLAKGTRLEVAISAGSTAPKETLATHHLYNGVPAASLPGFESPSAVYASSFGAVGDGVADDLAALEAALKKAAAGSEGVVVLGRGVFRVSRTLALPSGVSLVGAGLHLSSLVPTSVGFDGTAVLRTTRGASVLGALSVTTWAHFDVSCVEWGGGALSIWLQVHVNRMTECGIAGGTPLASTIGDTPIPACRPRVRMSRPLVHVSGGGSFYNFYNEDAMGNMVAHDYQLPSYRHILLEGARSVRLYHFNPEHSVANANSEFRDASDISVFGTKSEGHSATIWVRNCTDIVHTGHGGNAYPLSCDEKACAAWRPSPCACDWQGTPSLFRVEGCSGNCRFGNLWSQGTKPPGFAAVWASLPGGGNISTAQMEAPAVVVMSDTLKCASEHGSIRCE